MDHEVHVVFLEHIQAGLGLERTGSAEQDVGDVRTHHGTAPAVSEGRAHGTEHDVVHFLVNTHGRAVHHLHHFAVNGPRCNTELFPDLLSPLWSTGQIGKLAPLLAELFEKLQRDLLGHFIHGLAFHIDAEMACNAVQLAHVLDLEILGLTLCHCQQGVREISRMVRVCCCACGHHACKIPRRYHRQGSAANAHGLIFLAHQSAGTHMTHLAACALVSDGAGFERFSPFKGRLYFFLSCHLKEYLGSRVN